MPQAIPAQHCRTKSADEKPSFGCPAVGGASGMNRPPLAIYGAMRRCSAQHFRATLLGYFCPWQHHRNSRLLVWLDSGLPP